MKASEPVLLLESMVLAWFLGIEAPASFDYLVNKRRRRRSRETERKEDKRKEKKRKEKFSKSRKNREERWVGTRVEQTKDSSRKQKKGEWDLKSF
jgi:hypothetical protein